MIFQTDNFTVQELRQIFYGDNIYNQLEDKRWLMKFQKGYSNRN